MAPRVLNQRKIYYINNKCNQNNKNTYIATYQYVFTLFDDVYVTPCIFVNNYVKKNNYGKLNLQNRKFN